MVVLFFDLKARKYLLLRVFTEAFSLGHERRAGMAGSTASDGSKEDQQMPVSDTQIVPSLELTARAAALRTVPIAANLFARTSICDEFSLGKRM